MNAIQTLLTDHLDIWTSTLLTKSIAGRGSNSKLEAYGIKKLRGLILELAVRGKLVPQDPNDEPASDLLKKIAAEKSRLLEEGRLTKKLSLPDVAEDEKYFSLPNGWAWSRLGEATNYGITDKAESGDVDEDTWILDLEDIEKETSRLLQKTRFAEKPFQSSKNRFAKGDVIYGKLRPYLDKVIVADEDGVCTTEMIPARGYADISPFYLRLVMKTPHFIKYADDSTHGMNLPRLGTDKARMALFPLAPYNEQHRIVAKVDELMALCDQLEQQQTHSIEAHQTLVETLLGTLTRVVSQQEFRAAWARIASHLDTLFSTEASIDQLKQTILQLAVMGKLVPQDPNDEPAAVLLKNIAEEQDRLAKEGKIKKPKELAKIADDEKPFELPKNWEYVRLNDLGEWGAGATPSRGRHEYYGGDIPWFKSGELVVDFISESEERVTALALKETSLRYNKPGDVLIAMYGATIGKTSILNVAATTNQAVCACTPFTGFSNVFLLTLFKAFKGRFIDMGAGGAQPNISREKIIATVIALPPTQEQHRIVAKVDELMALCDALKARLAAAQAIQLHLADAIVEQAGG